MASKSVDSSVCLSELRSKPLPPRRPSEVPGRAGVERPVVLIVDDCADNRFALEQVLVRDDVEIVTAASGRAALDTLLERDVAVAILDVQMPEMDGFALAELMRGVQKTRYVPIVFVTAGSSDTSRVFKGYESGAVDYLFKPVDPQIFRSKVDVFVTLEQHRQQLRHADRMREMFIGILAHDLRNPLSAVLMSAQAALGRSADTVSSNALQRILRSGNRMVRLIDQTLDASRFRIGGGVALSPTTADLREITDHVLGEFEELRERFGVEAIGDTVGTWDPDRLLQVVSNLVGNAVQYSPAGSPMTVRIDGRREDTVVFEVHNVGAPIPEELRGVLFEPFRGSVGGARPTQRLGLGLYITRQIVLAHGGTLSFDSGEESGTRFVLKIPRHPPTARARTAQEKTILIVEDEDGARLGLSRLLKDLGHRLLVASKPSEAIELAGDHDGPVHLLLTDVRLPEMTGDELAAVLRNSQPEVQVIFMSGSPKPPAPASTFLLKPIDCDALVDAIERALA